MNPQVQRDPFDHLLGESPAVLLMKDRLRKFVGRPAESGKPVPVLLLGETGTGKGLLARAIHDAGPWRDGSFISINCAAIPELLVESELFGVERGAFTDARQRRAGLFQQASKGTLFLDEVALLPLAAQAKLLTAVEERWVRRVGSTRNETVSASIIAATSVDLEAAVRHGLFREDLYYRLAVVPISLPPLRERGADILLLARHFLARACSDYGIGPRSLAPDACALLMMHTWPGNVREVANLIERVALLSEDETIGADVLTAQAGLWSPALTRALIPPRGGGDRQISAQTLKSDASGDLPDFRSSVERFERSQLVDALAKTHWNVARTARLLGVPRNTLKYRMVKHGLNRGQGAGVSPRPARQRPRDAPKASERVEVVPLWSETRTVTFLIATVGIPARTDNGMTPGQTLADCLGKIDGFGGQVLRIGPSRIVAGFGIEPNEDSVGSAANAAIAVRQAVNRARGDAVLRAQIGIHTVRCEVGSSGTGAHQIDSEVLQQVEGTIQAMFESTASNEIILSDAAIPLLERHFTIQRSPLSPAANPTGILMGREWTGFGVGGRPLSPFVGRWRELRALLDLMGQAKAGQGGVVVLTGDPGAGKSRLLYEFRSRLSGHGIGLVEIRGAPHATPSPYMPFIHLMRRELGLPDDAPEAARSAALQQRLDQLHLDQEVTPYLEGLLGLEPAYGFTAELSFERRKQGILDALIRFVLAPGRGEIHVVLAEDAHWMDPASEELVTALADAVPSNRAILVTSHRPGYRPPWLDRSHASQLTLPPLTVEQGRLIIRNVISESVDLEEAIVARGEGNPFFLEELAWDTRQADASDASVRTRSAPPPTIEVVLGNRIDRLPVGLRRLLSTAAVIGRDVPVSILQAVSEDRKLAEHVSELVRFEFLRYHAGKGYAFKHALTQEVAYNKLAHLERSRMHTAVAQAIETAYATKLGDVYDLLAYHYTRTDESEKALEYLERLAGQAMQRYALVEATVAHEQARALSNRLPAGEARDRRVLELAIGSCLALVLLGKFGPLLQLLQDCHDELHRQRTSPLVAQYYFYSAIAYDHLGDAARAEECGLKAVDGAQRQGDTMTAGQSYMILSHSSLWAGNFRKGVERGDLAVSHLIGAGDSFFLGMSFHIRACNQILLGEFPRALESGEEARRIGEAIGDRRLQSYGLMIAGWVALRQGDTLRALEACERSATLAPDPLARAVVLGTLADVYAANGSLEQAQTALREALLLLKSFGLAPLKAWDLARLGSVCWSMANYEKARELAEEARALSEIHGYPYPRALAEHLLGRIAQSAARFEDAARWFGKAQSTFATLETPLEAAAVRLDLELVGPQSNARLPIGSSSPDAGATDEVDRARTLPERDIHEY